MNIVEYISLAIVSIFFLILFINDLIRHKYDNIFIFIWHNAVYIITFFIALSAYAVLTDVIDHSCTDRWKFIIADIFSKILFFGILVAIYSWHEKDKRCKAQSRKFLTNYIWLIIKQSKIHLYSGDEQTIESHISAFEFYGADILKFTNDDIYIKYINLLYNNHTKEYELYRYALYAIVDIICDKYYYCDDDAPIDKDLADLYSYVAKLLADNGHGDCYFLNISEIRNKSVRKEIQNHIKNRLTF